MKRKMMVEKGPDVGFDYEEYDEDMKLKAGVQPEEEMEYPYDDYETYRVAVIKTEKKYLRIFAPDERTAVTYASTLDVSMDTDIDEYNLSYVGEGEDWGTGVDYTVPEGFCCAEEESEQWKARTSTVKNDWTVLDEDDKNTFPPVGEDGYCLGYLLVSFANCSYPMIGGYRRDDEGGFFFVGGDDEESFAQYDLIVNAWKPLEQCYKEKE